MCPSRSSGSIGVESETLERFGIFQSQAEPNFFTPLIGSKVFVQLFVCNPSVASQQNYNFTKVAEKSWPAVLLAVVTYQGKPRLLNPPSRSPGVSRLYFLNYSNGFEAHAALQSNILLGHAPW